MESELANLAITENEKQQTGWYDLPYEMRIMIIEMMDTKTKGNLSSCSKLCCTEVRQSKNFITLIEFSDWHDYVLTVGYHDYSTAITFWKYNENEKEQILISYTRPSSYEEIFMKIDPKFDKIVDVSAKDAILEQFNRFVNDAIHLKKIEITLGGFPFNETSIAHLTKLETIIIERSGFDLLECGFLSINQLASASKKVDIKTNLIEIDQLIKFKASEINLRNVQFSQTQLNQLLYSWNKDEIDENINIIQFEFTEVPNFKGVVDVVINELNGIPKDNDNVDICFKIKNNAEKLAQLGLDDNLFIFYLNIPDEESDTSEEEDDYEYESSDEYYDL